MNQDEIPEVEELDKSTYDYFSAVLDITGKEFNDQEDSDIYFRNVFNSMKGHELQIICHRRLSYALANIISYANEEQLLLILEEVKNNFILIARHPCGSHVLQSLLEMSLTHIASAVEDHEKLIKKISKLGILVGENLDQMLICPQSCHVISTMLEVLSGCKVSDQLTRNKKTPSVPQKGFKKGEESVLKDNVLKAPEKFLKMLKILITRMMKIEDLVGILAKAHSSYVVQTALLVLKKCDTNTCRKLVELLMLNLFGDVKKTMELMSNCIYSPLIEKIIEAFTQEQYTSFLNSNMKGNLKEICLHPFANYVAQTLLRSCASKAELESMFEELETCWSDILSIGHMGVLVALSSACAKLGCCQAKFIQTTCELLHCSEPKAKELFVPLVVRLMRYEDFTDQRNKNILWKLNFHGSWLIQNMLRFQKPFAVTESMFKMATKDLVTLFCNVAGSHLLDAFSESPTISKKKKTLLIEKLKGHFTRLACDKYASHGIEKLWKAVDVQAKYPMMEDLAQNEFQLQDNKFGSIIHHLFAVAMYKKRPKDWSDWHNRGAKKKEMFKDIIQSETKKKPKNKKPRLH